MCNDSVIRTLNNAQLTQRKAKKEGQKTHKEQSGKIHNKQHKGCVFQAQRGSHGFLSRENNRRILPYFSLIYTYRMNDRDRKEGNQEEILLSPIHKWQKQILDHERRLFDSRGNPIPQLEARRSINEESRHWLVCDLQQVP